MADSLQLVALRVADIGAVIIRVVMRAEAGGAFVAAAHFERLSVECIVYPRPRRGDALF